MISLTVATLYPYIADVINKENMINSLLLKMVSLGTFRLTILHSA